MRDSVAGAFAETGQECQLPYSSFHSENILAVVAASVCSAAMASLIVPGATVSLIGVIFGMRAVIPTMVTVAAGGLADTNGHAE
jgi:hypothetical protein